MQIDPDISKSSPAIQGKLLDEWEGRWKRMGLLAFTDLSQFKSLVGIYRFVFFGRVMYVGKATAQKTGRRGLRHRLSSYMDPSADSCKHKARRLVKKLAEYLVLDVIVTGAGSTAVVTAVALEKHMIRHHQPPWNVARNFKDVA